MVPKISVIVPVYNVEPYLCRCVDSILHQSFPDFDLVLVDDGSSDNCGAICDGYAARDSRVHVIHQENGGLSAARNSGIDWSFAGSDSRWLAFVDSDDWVHRDYLKLLLTAAEELDAGVAMGDYHWTGEQLKDEDLSGARPLGMDPEQAMAEHYSLCTPAWGKIFRKDLFAQTRFPEGKLYEDAYVTHKLIFEAGRVAVYLEKLCYYYNNPTSITRAKWSDRKLDSIEAHELRLQYFEEHGYEKALRREKEAYVEDLMDKVRHLLDTRQGSRDHEATLRMMQGKLRTALASARAEGLMPFNRENLWCYLYAMRTDAVWKAARAVHQVYRKWKRE